MNAERPSSIVPPLPNPWPAGYMLNSFGTLVREDLIRAQVRLEDQTVLGLIGRANALHEEIVAGKRAAIGEVEAFLDILAAQYRAKPGRRGGTELLAFDGLSKVTLTVSDSIEFGAEISAAKLLIDECIAGWSAGGNDNIRKLVDVAFKVGRTGKIATDRIMSLRRIKIDDMTWLRAMMAIEDAMRVAASKSYLRFYTRAKPDGAWVQIPLDFAGV